MIDSHRCYTCYIFELQEWNWNFRFSRQKFQGLHFLFCASYKRYFYASFYTTYIFDSFYIQWYISLHPILHRSKWIEIDSILTLWINHSRYKVIGPIWDNLLVLDFIHYYFDKASNWLYKSYFCTLKYVSKCLILWIILKIKNTSSNKKAYFCRNASPMPSLNKQFGEKSDSDSTFNCQICGVIYAFRHEQYSITSIAVSCMVIEIGL